MYQDRKQFDWNVRPNSTISKIPNIFFLRKGALFIRNILIYIRKKRDFIKNLFNPYEKLIRNEYKKAIDLAIYYINGHIDGDIGEFGTHGVTASIICNHLAYYNIEKKVHLFDSFEGFPAATEKEDINSHHVKSGVWFRGSSSPSISPSKLRKKLQRRGFSPEKLKIYEGMVSRYLIEHT